MIDCQRIKLDCFWDMDISSEDIENIARKADFREKALLFEKILINSSKLFQDLSIFNKNDLRKLLTDYQISGFNHDYIFRRKNLAEVYFLNKPLQINELKWIE